MLKVISWNVNGFMGKQYDGRADIEAKKKNAKKIAAYLETHNAAIIVLQEFSWDLRKGAGNEVGEWFLECMHARIFNDTGSSKEYTYEVHFPIPVTTASTNKLTVILIRTRTVSSSKREKTKHTPLTWANLAQTSAQYGDKNISILGMYMPVNYSNSTERRESFRRAIREFAKDTSNKKELAMVIGDFNAATNADREKQKDERDKTLIESKKVFHILADYHFRDVLEQKKEEKIYSYYHQGNKKDGRRLDYAFVSESVQEKFSYTVFYDEDSLELSDHTVLSVTFTEK